MKKKDYDLVQALIEEITDGLGDIADGGPVRTAHLLVALGRLKRLVRPPMTMEDVLDLVPGDTITAKVKRIGISRTGYYGLLAGTASRQKKTLKLLVDASGVPESIVKEIW